jgi:hypothetical protein
MTKPRLQRKTAGLAPGGNGTPFLDAELAEIYRHEWAHDRINHVPGSEAFDIGGLKFIYAKCRGDTVASWQWLLESTKRIETFNKKHSIHEACWHAFPKTSADVERVIRWRSANPRS